MNRTSMECIKTMFAIAALSAASVGLTHDRDRPSQWSAPIRLGAPPNTEFVEVCPSISWDGNSLYFFSDRPDGLGGNDLWVSHRDRRTGEWREPQNLGDVVNTPFDDSAAWLSPHGYELYFASDRPGGAGGLDLWVTRRTNRHDDFAWGPPTNLGAVNTSSSELSPSRVIENGRVVLYFASNRPGGLGFDDIYKSVFDVRSRAFGPAELVTELSSPAVDRIPTPNNDGSEMFITSARPGTFGLLDIWVSLRERTSHTQDTRRVEYKWSTPINLGAEFNSSEVDGCARVSRDGRTMYLHSTRFGGFPLFDLYVSERIHRHGP